MDRRGQVNPIVQICRPNALAGGPTRVGSVPRSVTHRGTLRYPRTAYAQQTHVGDISGHDHPFR